MPHHLAPGWDHTDLPTPDDVRPAWSATQARVAAARAALVKLRKLKGGETPVWREVAG